MDGRGLICPSVTRTTVKKPGQSVRPLPPILHGLQLTGVPQWPRFSTNEMDGETANCGADGRQIRIGFITTVMEELLFATPQPARRPPPAPCHHE